MSKNTQQEFKIQDKYIMDCGRYGAIYLKDDPSCICDIEHVNNSINEHIQQELTRQKDELRVAIENHEFKFDIEEYLPLVEAWKGGYDVPFDDGYKKAKDDILTLLK